MIINPVNAKYVGSSVDIERRFKQYKYLRYNEQPKIRNSIKKYGIKNHKFVILELCSKGDLLERERFHCIKHNVLHRYNLNLKIPLKGENHKSFSKEVLDKISKKHKNKKLSEEHKEKLISSVKGKKQTKEHINKRKMFGEKNHAYGKESYFKGKNHTEETKIKLSEHRKGKYKLEKNPRAKKIIDIENNIIYGSLKEVSIKFNINYSTLRAMLQNRNPNKTKFRYYE